MDNQAEFTFACPHCGQHLEADLDMAGIEVECPSCGKAMTVPLPVSREDGCSNDIPPPPIITVVRSKEGFFARNRKWLIAVAGGAAAICVFLNWAIQFHTPSMSADQEVFNEILYLLNEDDLSSDKALSVLQEYDMNMLRNDTKKLIGYFAETMEEVARLEAEERKIQASREQRVASAKSAGRRQGAGAGWQVANMADSVSEEGVGLLGYLLFAAVGASAQSDNLGKQMEAQIDSEITEIANQKKDLLRRYESVLAQYRHSSAYRSFDQGLTYSRKLVESEWEEAQKKTGFAEKPGERFMDLFDAGYRARSRFRIPEIIKPMAAFYGKEGMKKLLEDNPSENVRYREIFKRGIDLYLASWPKSRMRNAQEEFELKELRKWLSE